MNLLSNKRYLVYGTKISFTNFGYTLYMITVPAYSFLFSGSIIFTGLALFIEYGIYALTFLAGPIVDRVQDKRLVIIGSEIAIGITSLVFGYMIRYRAVTPASFLFIIGIIAVAWDLIWTADWTVLPVIVGEDDLPRANGYMTALGNSHVVAGLGIGGFLFVVLGPYSSMIVYALCMFSAGILTFFIPVIVKKEDWKHSEGLASGWRYVFKENRLLLKLSIVLAFFSFFAIEPQLGITDAFAPISTLLYSLMFSLYYTGAIISGIIFGKIYHRLNLPKTMALLFLISGVLFITSSNLAGIEWLDAISWMLLGFTFSAYVTLYGSYLQLVSAKEMLGRAASNLYTFRGVSSAAGTLMLPFLFQQSGYNGVISWSGIVICLASLFFLWLAPSFSGNRILESTREPV